MKIYLRSWSLLTCFVCLFFVMNNQASAQVPQPVFTDCPSDFSINSDNNSCSATNVTYTSLATNNPTYTYVFTGATTDAGNGTGSGSSFNVGTTLVTITATNPGGTATCDFNVTVVDATAPTINCPPSQVYQCASEVQPHAADLAAFLAEGGTVSDNCSGNITIAWVKDDITPGNCANNFMLFRYYEATDAAGNKAQCSQQIEVNDNIPPGWTSRVFDLDRSLDCADANGLVAARALNPTASDNCTPDPVITYLGEIKQDLCPNSYTLTRTWSVADVCGNQSPDIYTQTITVTDQTAPTITTPSRSLDRTLDCGDANGLAAALALEPAATDNCGNANINLQSDNTVTDPNCPNGYTRTRTWNFNDDCFNFSNDFTQIIHVTDHTAPVITACPAPVTYSGCSTAVITQFPYSETPVSVTYNDFATLIQGGAMDACGDVTTSYQDTKQVGCAIIVTRTWTITDNCGNTATCQQTISIVHTIAPVTPNNGSANINCASAATAPTAPVVNDQCGNRVIPTGPVQSGTYNGCQGTIIFTYTYTDCAQLTSTWQYVYTVQPAAPAVPANGTATVECGSQAVAPTLPVVTSCGNVLTASAPVITGTYAGCEGTRIYTYTYTNCANVTSTWSFTYTIDDNTAPVITGIPANTTVSCAANVPAPNNNLVVATDNCGSTLTITSQDVTTPGSCANRFSVARTYRVADCAGNSSTATQTITVNDQTGPTITNCPQNVTVTTGPNACTATATWSAPGATDNCGGAVNMTNDHNPGETFPIGITPVTYSFTDACGNSSSCRFTVTVVDNSAPVFTCPSNITVAPNGPNCSADVNTPFPVITDNCTGANNLSVSWTMTGATNNAANGYLGLVTYNSGTTIVTYTAVDASGNSSTCTFTVTVASTAITGTVSGNAVVPQNPNNTSPVTFTANGGVGPYTFTYTIKFNGNPPGPAQTVTTAANSNTVVVQQSNAVSGTYLYTLLSVSGNGCVGTVTQPTANIIVSAGAAGFLPDLTSSQFFSQLIIPSGQFIDEVIAIRNVGPGPTSGPIVFSITNYMPLTGLTVTENNQQSLTIGPDVHPLDNGNWVYNPVNGTFTSNGIVIFPGEHRNIGIRISREGGATGAVTQTTTIPPGTGGGETPFTNNTISNSLLKN